MVTPRRSVSLTTAKRISMKKEFAAVTPGEMLKEEFLAEYGLSQNQLAKAIGISPNRIAEIISNRRRVVLRSQALESILTTLRKRIANFEAQAELAASNDFAPGHASSPLAEAP